MAEGNHMQGAQLQFLNGKCLTKIYVCVVDKANCSSLKEGVGSPNCRRQDTEKWCHRCDLCTLEKINDLGNGETSGCLQVRPNLSKWRGLPRESSTQMICLEQRIFLLLFYTTPENYIQLQVRNNTI